jgi:Sulfotransferase family
MLQMVVRICQRHDLRAEPPRMGAGTRSYTRAPMPGTGPIRRFRTKWKRRRAHNFERSVWREVGGGLLGQLYLDRGDGPADTILLAGHDRSGTTWIAEALNHRKDLRYIYEPFHPGRVDATRVFTPRLYLRPEDRDATYLDAARAVLSGQVRSLWADKYNRAFLPKRRLVKEVRSNLLLPWLSASFPETRIVFMLRHPCAVANSERRLSGSWHIDLSRFLSQPALMADYLEPFRARIEAAAAGSSDWDKRVCVWCIENHVPLTGLDPTRMHVAFYEDFCVDPGVELRRLYDFVAMPFDPGALETLAKPSATSRKDSAVLSGEDLVEAWRRSVTPEEVASTMSVVEAFGLDRIYGADPMPRWRPVP